MALLPAISAHRKKDDTWHCCRASLAPSALHIGPAHMNAASGPWMQHVDEFGSCMWALCTWTRHMLHLWARHVGKAFGFSAQADGSLRIHGSSTLSTAGA